MKVIGYSRVVPAEDADVALKHHRERIESYCSNKSLTLVNYFEEQISGDTAYGATRPALMEAISNLGDGMALVVVRLNRLSGQKAILAPIIEAIENKGARVIAVQGPATLAELSSTLEVTSRD